MRLVFIVLLPLVLSAAEIGVNGWTAVGPGASVETADGVLTLHYEASGGARRSMAVLPARGIALAEMKALRFEVKTDSPFAVAFVMAEKKPGGGNYSAVIWSNGGEWQPVVLKPADFSQNDDANNTPDPDGKLDLDRVENVALVDLSQFLAGMSQNPSVYAEPHSGPHAISARHFEVLGDAVPAAEPQSAWFGLGGSSFEQKDGATVIRYRGAADRYMAFTRLLPDGNVKGATHLAMDIQSDRDVQLVVSLRDGQKRHNIDCFVPAGTKPDHRELLLSAFSDWTPDISRIQSVVILDIDGDTVANSITIRDLRFVSD